MGSGFSGNAYTDHGRRREPEIAAWVAATHGIFPSSALFHAEVERRHLATPDGIAVDAEGRVTLAEITTPGVEPVLDDAQIGRILNTIVDNL